MRTTHADRPNTVAAVVVAVVAAPSSLSLPSPPPASSSASASFSTFPPPPPPSCYRRRRLTLEKRERKRQRGAPSDHRNGIRSGTTRIRKQITVRQKKNGGRCLLLFRGTSSSFTASRTSVSFCHAPLGSSSPSLPLSRRPLLPITCETPRPLSATRARLKPASHGLSEIREELNVHFYECKIIAIYAVL